MCTRTFCTVTFGCKVNQYESQALRERLADAGLVPCDELRDGADAYIVNTCTVTDRAFREARSYVRALARRNPSARIAVTGCAADSNAADFEDLPGVRVFRNASKPEIVPHLLSELLPERPKDERPLPLTISRFDGHTRAFLKIQDGCDLHCSFCIIPRVRGPNRSRSPEEVLEEARRLVQNGYREIVLTGVHLGSYGRDTTHGRGLPALLERMLDLSGLARVRLSSIECNEVDADLIRLMREEPRRVCPHLHMPAQSGSDAILRAMRRRYNVARFLRTVDQVREAVPDVGLTTDLIVGFPGETEEHFEETLEFCRRVGFGRIHIFPYSRREGTDAARLPDLPPSVKRNRCERLEKLARESAASFASRFLGRSVAVLVEQVNGAARGYTEHYVPARLAAGRRGEIVSAYGRAVQEGTLLAEAECRT